MGWFLMIYAIVRTFYSVYGCLTHKYFWFDNTRHTWQTHHINLSPRYIIMPNLFAHIQLSDSTVSQNVAQIADTQGQFQ